MYSAATTFHSSRRRTILVIAMGDMPEDQKNTCMFPMQPMDVAR